MTALIATAAAPVETCTAGGLLVSTGLDLDDSGILDDDEVTQTQSVCNGVNGTDGTDGADGVDGEDGADGTSCNVVDNGDGTKTISCPGGGTVIVPDDADGTDGAGSGGPNIMRPTEVSIHVEEPIVFEVHASLAAIGQLRLFLDNKVTAAYTLAAGSDTNFTFEIVEAEVMVNTEPLEFELQHGVHLWGSGGFLEVGIGEHHLALVTEDDVVVGHATVHLLP